jgi:hypothetical protein
MELLLQVVFVVEDMVIVLEVDNLHLVGLQILVVMVVLEVVGKLCEVVALVVVDMLLFAVVEDILVADVQDSLLVVVEDSVAVVVDILVEEVLRIDQGS